MAVNTTVCLTLFQTGIYILYYIISMEKYTCYVKKAVHVLAYIYIYTLTIYTLTMLPADALRTSSSYKALGEEDHFCTIGLILQVLYF